LAQGMTPVDLVSANISEHLSFPESLFEQAIQEAIVQARVYRPDPLGQLAARQAISRYYQPLNIPADQIVLTPGSSISYFYCFKLLADPGEEILSPLPSYPLLDHIAELAGVKIVNYRLIESNNWSIDFDHLQSSINKKTRAIVLISPHNPTGMVCNKDEISRLVDIAKDNELPIISDEVFAEFLFEENAELHRPAGTDSPLVFTLNGFSKSLCLPGIKLAWIAVSGERALVERSIKNLELTSDTFLPVNEMVQFASARLLDESAEFRHRLRDWVKERYKQTLSILDGLGFISPKAGFYLSLPVEADEMDLCLRLLKECRILLHPGHFYDMDGEHLVFSFVQNADLLAGSLESIKKTLVS